MTLSSTEAEGKGGWITVVHHFTSSMAQNFAIALAAWGSCFVVTILVSAVTTPKPAHELRNLVYGMTDMPSEANLPWHQRPLMLAGIVSVILIGLNIIFW